LKRLWTGDNEDPVNCTANWIQSPSCKRAQVTHPSNHTEPRHKQCTPSPEHYDNCLTDPTCLCATTWRRKAILQDIISLMK